jgi:hypothetical protein
LYTCGGFYIFQQLLITMFSDRNQRRCPLKRLTVLCLCLGFLGGVIVFPSAVFGYVEADTYGVRVDENVPINLLPQQMRDYYPANTGWNVTLGYICASSCEESEIIYDWDCYGEPYNYARWKFPVCYCASPESCMECPASGGRLGGYNYCRYGCAGRRY